MGTTMSFYQIKNEGFSRGQLQDLLRQHFAKDPENALSSFEDALSSNCGEEVLQSFRQYMSINRRFRKDCGLDGQDRLPSPVIAYRPDAAWLPFYQVDLCEGYIATARDTLSLSQLFGVPVLAFAVYDSDAMFLSYADAKAEMTIDYVKPNFEGMEEFEGPGMHTEFPTLLPQLCPGTPEETLRGIWEGKEVFADDRAHKLCEALGSSLLNYQFPEDAQAITLA